MHAAEAKELKEGEERNPEEKSARERKNARGAMWTFEIQIIIGGRFK